MHLSVRFSGIYLKGINVQEMGTSSGTSVKVAVNNDANGNHLEKYASIVGPDTYSNNKVEGEQLFQFNSSYGCFHSRTEFLAGYKEIPNDSGKKALVLELINELKGLYPNIQNKMKDSAEYYFTK